MLDKTARGRWSSAVDTEASRLPDRARPARVWTWLLEHLAAERERWLLWLPVGLGTGIAIYFALPAEPPAWLGAIGVVLAACGIGLGRRRPAVLIAAAGLGAMALGLASAQLRTHIVAAPVLKERLGPVWIVGMVLEVEPRPAGGRVILHRLEVPNLAAAETPARVRIRLSPREPTDVRPGAWLRVRAVLRPPPSPAAPGAYDFARQAFFRGLGAVGFALGPVQPLAPPATPSTGSGAGAEAGQATLWRLWWSGLRNGAARRILDAIPGEAGAVAAALMTGERGAIPDSLIEAMRNSGLAHLLAISGLHVGLVAGLLFFAVRALLALSTTLALRYPIKKWAAGVAALGAFAYLSLVGATVPTQRAFLMVALVLLAVLLDRTAVSLRLVAWAALVILLIAPESLVTASFQMSFAAVTALVAGYEALGRRGRVALAKRSLIQRAALYLAGVALTSVIATVATAPFAVYHFNRMALYGLAANMIAVPLTAFWIMPWALVGFLLMPFGGESMALIPMAWGIDAMTGVAKTVAAWPGAVVTVRAMPPVALALIVLGGLWLCLWQRSWRLLGLAAVLAGLSSLPSSRPPDLLASGDGRLLAVRDPEGRLWLSTTRAARFTADVWLRRVGQPEGHAWPLEGGAADGRLSCDSLGCIYRDRGHVVALVRDGRALTEDCRIATVLIAVEPVRRHPCPAPGIVIDRFDLWREGGHALWLSPAGVEVRSVRGSRGQRPWVASPESGP